MTKESLEPLDLYTVPTTYINAGFERFGDIPYRRIIGIAKKGMETIWSSIEPRGVQVPFSKLDTDKEGIEATFEFGSRLIDFFKLYFTIPEDELPRTSIHKGYNCHKFARWMKDGDPRSLEAQALIPPNSVPALNMPTEANLPLGAEGVVGSRIPVSGRGIAEHSVVGLGLDIGDCVQVMGLSGHLGVSSYDTVKANYQSQIPDREIKIFPVQ